MKPLRVLFWLIVLAALASAAYVNYPPFRLFTLVMMGRSEACPLSSALECSRNLDRQVEFKDQILNASSLVQQDNSFHLWQTPKGRFWIPQGSDYLLPYDLAEQRRRIYGAGANGPHAGDIVLDCGANIGVTVREELSAGADKIIAIEPAPENLECLRRTFPAEIAAGRLVIYPKGVWNKDDVLTFRVDPKNSGNDSFVIRREGSVDVANIPLTTIDHLVRELKLPRVNYIKMDISGAEVQALQGAHDTLQRDKPRISVASYYDPDEVKNIPRLVHASRPGYIQECGPCSETSRGIRPDVLYFH